MRFQLTVLSSNLNKHRLNVDDVRIDVWVDEQRKVLVGLRVTADTATRPEAFLLELRVTEIEPAGLRIDPPR